MAARVFRNSPFELGVNKPAQTVRIVSWHGAICVGFAIESAYADESYIARSMPGIALTYPDSSEWQCVVARGLVESSITENRIGAVPVRQVVES